MTLQHALHVVQRETAGAHLKELKVAIACGFTPLHLKTFINASLVERYSNRRVQVTTGLYGDLRASIKSAKAENPAICFVPIEWADLDGRLDIRRLGSWDPSQLEDITNDVAKALADIASLLEDLASGARVVGSLPTLLPPPVGYFPTFRLSDFSAGLQKLLYGFAERVIRSNVQIVDDSSLDRSSSRAHRHDIQADLAYGFPYSREHAADLAAALVDSSVDPPLMKGIITDLDNTFWAGIVGEIGPEAVSWDLAGNAQTHGLYQQLLDSLAGGGILVAVASKNDPAVVEEAFRRPDLVMKSERIFPLMVGWRPKSESVRRILDHWNIGPEAVVCVDDSLMELDEIKRAFPEITVVQFPADDPQAVYEELNTLRDLFGRGSLQKEDGFRADTLRNRMEFQRDIESRSETMDVFLSDLHGVLAIDKTKDPGNRRPLELINKTNQFNMNGVRLELADWSRHLADPNGFQWIIDYRDKYGPLGAISVVLGSVFQGQVRIHTWVMSCRAFSRRIEHCVLKLLFDGHEQGTIVFDYAQTSRNGPFRDFLAAYGAVAQPGAVTISSSALAKAPPLFLRVANGQAVETANRFLAER